MRNAGIIFCSCGGPRLPDELVRTADEVYVRLHGPERWYHHNYSDEELLKWASRIRGSGAKRAWIYFNNDYDAHAPDNAQALYRMLAPSSPNGGPPIPLRNLARSGCLPSAGGAAGAPAKPVGVGMLFWFSALTLMSDALEVMDMRLRQMAVGNGTSDEMFLMVARS
ncbi:DUF72 domain-containing protein [Bradyrhizobium sp. USDA 4486]